MVTSDYVPARGDVVWLNFDPQAGHEQAGRRPAVVLSPATYNRKVGLALMCPITSKKKGYPFEIEIPIDTPVSGVVLTDQIKSFDWRVRQTEHACALPGDLVDQVLTRARLLLA
ncbi:MAG TPA: endoribonuclease MazF [Candidatus Bathyarchaeia archaeon]|nr:endoribonuclease MazF [Candidatus Bathyarchaeia archaeon]